MHEKVYFSFFILCAILLQGILAKLLEEDFRDSSKLVVRQKRVIDRSQGGDRPNQNGDIPYVVNLKKSSRFHCIGTILSHHTAITAAQCVVFDLLMYSVYSGSAYSHLGNEHNVTEKKVHSSNPSRSIVLTAGIALITVNPPFVYSRNTNRIPLYSEPVLAGMTGTISGWGTHVYSGRVETAYAKRLRSIDVPVMNHRNCVNIYRGQFPILEEDVCTYHPQKLCGETDAGAPLVIEQQLVGVFIGILPTPIAESNFRPDIFILLQHSNYASWIARNIVH